MKEIVTQKTCSKCKSIKSVTEFYKGKICKLCCVERARQWVLANPEKRKEIANRYARTHPEITHKWSKNNPQLDREAKKKWRLANPEKQKAAKVAWYEKQENKERTSKKTKEWKLLNPEKIKEARRKFRENNPLTFRIRSANRKALILKSGGKVAAKDWQEVLEKYGTACLNPKCPDPSKPVTMDHVIPLVKGGKHDKDNLQPLCLSCNSSKGAKTIDYR